MMRVGQDLRVGEAAELVADGVEVVIAETVRRP